MAQNLIGDLIDTYWASVESALDGLDGNDHAVLNTANGAVDTIWDNHVFEHGETFGGTEIGFARALSARVLQRLLGVEYAALASVAGAELPSSKDAALDGALEQARREALDTFSGDLLGPVRAGDRLVYAQPLQVDSPVPVGAVVLAAAETLSGRQVRLLDGFRRHLDTRLDLAEKLLKMRWRSLELEYELRKLRGELKAPEPRAAGPRAPLPEDLTRSLAELAAAVPAIELFGVSLPSEHYESWCRGYQSLTSRYLEIFDQADHLFLDVPSGVDAKDEDSTHAAPYRALLEVIGRLRDATRLLFHVAAGDVAPYLADDETLTFAEITRIAKGHADDDATAAILDIMNDQGEAAEVDALTARRHPYEFRAANVGEVFALLALYQTLSDHAPDQLGRSRAGISAALRRYQAARAYLLSYDRFEEVPLKGADRTQPPDAEKLLLYREEAPAFDVVLSAWAR